MNEPYIQSLRSAIQTSHKCISRYAQTVAVKEESKGQTLWDGNVEVFDLAGHAVARQCFAWGYKDAAGRRQFVAMLKDPEIDSARKAVKAFIATQPKPA